MEKFNNFVEKYEVPLWQILAALSFFVEFILNKKVPALFGEGVFFCICNN